MGKVYSADIQIGFFWNSKVVIPMMRRLGRVATGCSQFGKGAERMLSGLLMKKGAVHMWT